MQVTDLSELMLRKETSPMRNVQMGNAEIFKDVARDSQFLDWESLVLHHDFYT